MEKIKRELNIYLISGILGTVIVTLLAPTIIKLLFTSPISFGVNCEPAANWSMSKLVSSQIFGFLAGPVAAFIFLRTRRRSDSPKAVNTDIHAEA